jgi:hypothetical protein
LRINKERRGGRKKKREQPFVQVIPAFATAIFFLI